MIVIHCFWHFRCADILKQEVERHHWPARTRLTFTPHHTSSSLFFFPPPLCLGVVRASNIFPILSAILLLMGGVCIAASRFYKSKRNIILGAGILFVAAGKNIGSDSAFVCWRVYANVRASLDMPKVVLWNVWKGLFMSTIMPFLLKVIFKAASCKIHLFRLQVKKKCTELVTSWHL